MLTFQELATKVRRQKGVPDEYSGTLLSLDPGETTGWAVFSNNELINQGQISTPNGGLGATGIENLINQFHPTHIVMESYRVYKWKTESHAWADLHTPRLIGAIEYLSWVRNLPLTTQQPADAKHFSTDDKLHDWDMWAKGEPHARDAIRHGTYFILFNGKV